MAKVEEFVSSVRGRLYSVGNDDGLRSLTCSELAAAFYQHMGWLAPGSKVIVGRLTEPAHDNMREPKKQSQI